MASMTPANVPAASGSPAASPPSGVRLTGLDAARALAIIGMIAVNVGPRGEPGIAGFVYDLPVGRASILFVVLAGVGMSFLTRSARRPGGRLPWRTVLWRSALLFAGGLALQELGHDVSVILAVYGVLFLLSLPLLKAPTPVIAALAGTLLAVGPVAWIGAQLASGTAFQFADPDLSNDAPHLLHRIFLSGSYPVLVWCVPFLVGLILGRAPLTDRRLQKRLVVWGGVAAIGAYALSQVLIRMLGQPGDEIGWDRLLSAVGHSQMPLWLVSSIGTALVALGGFLWAGNLVDRRLGMLVSAGRLSLSIYVAHLFVLAAIIRPEPHTLLRGYLITIVLSAVLVLLAHLWVKWRPIGPLEQLMRLPGQR
ncbi:membrane protein [Citricoccus zhacaiensis]|uniref:Membrane protein n=2 Tax=Citricoccus zhacaiensis TaxID=489142 RepID=A0ABQ2LU14_9MICC|nr:membrane protein [Citricoccus zhacaiensis]